MPVEDAALPTVAVIIPTGGQRPELLSACVRAVLEDSGTTEVLISADLQPDEPLPALPHDPRITVLRVPAVSTARDERGQRARDFAVGHAHADVVLALDDDVVAAPGLVSAHALHHTLAQDLVIVGYMPVAWFALSARWRPAARYYSRSYEAACSKLEKHPSDVLTGLWGGNVSLRRVQWLRVRESHRIFGGYHGDLEFGLRLAHAGLQGIFDRNLRAQHCYRRTVYDLSTDQENAAAARVRLHRAYPAHVPFPRVRPSSPAARLALSATSKLAAADVAWRPLRRAIIVAVYTAEALKVSGSADLLVRLLCRTAFVRSLNRVQG